MDDYEKQQEKLNHLLKEAANIVKKSGQYSARIQSPEDAAALLMEEMSFLDQEEMRVIVLSTKNDVIKIDNVYRGTVNTTTIRVAELFRQAIIENAPGIILAHNHPSGSPDPSPEDISVTRAVIEAGKILDIELLDHIVIGKGVFTSIKKKGVIPGL